MIHGVLYTSVKLSVMRGKDSNLCLTVNSYSTAHTWADRLQLHLCVIRKFKSLSASPPKSTQGCAPLCVQEKEIHACCWVCNWCTSIKSGSCTFADAKKWYLISTNRRSINHAAAIAFFANAPWATLIIGAGGRARPRPREHTKKAKEPPRLIMKSPLYRFAELLLSRC